VRTSDEGFEQPGGPVRGEEGRGVRGGSGVHIGAVLMAITQEKSTGVLLRRPFPETEREGEDCGRREMTCGAHMAARGERAEGTGLGRGDVGPWAHSGRGLERLPGVRFHIFPFFTSFSFLFS
jgi:hypothetical protein